VTVVVCSVGDPLRKRELEVLELAALGYSCDRTAKDLYLSIETVKTYRQRIIRKLGARNITHAVAVAVASGVVARRSVVDGPFAATGDVMSPA
jgi:DNA-binding CsgD family transcriptional regulator